ncbi:hypothetical protein AY601_4087 [Pedobacter cryoconitis]|uniref:Uncharacterized protein n=2 Tax=Pedobacter cryoconitis TaxID=188932 RepID=A0A127VI44_9SPHI|nr:hypothetical protein AY601_4087 [Pedobacter cryoconitis]
MLKTLFASKGFSQKAIEGLAEYLAPNLTEESTAEEMTAAITAIEPMTSLMQSEINRQVTEAKKTKTVEDSTITPVEEPKPAVPATTDPVMLELLNQVKTLAQGLAAVQTKEVAITRKDLLLAKLEKTPEVYKAKALKDFARMKFETQEEFDEFLAESETDAASAIQGASDAGLGGDAPPKGYVPAKGADEKEVSPAMKELIAERAATAAAKAN